MLTLLALVPIRQVDEAAFSRAAVPMPEVAVGKWPDWRLYTA